MSKVLSLVFLSIASALPVLAVDGVTLISQATVNAAGGFPYKITQPGSYRLAGNLAPINTSAIHITADYVTLDLNGFSISCTACNGVTGISSIGIYTTIENGIITGFYGNISGSLGSSAVPVGNPYAIWFQADEGKLDHMIVAQSLIGVYATAGENPYIANSVVKANVLFGIFAPASMVTLMNSIVAGNGVAGIFASSGFLTGNTFMGNGVIGIGARGAILCIGAPDSVMTLTNNVISHNPAFGIILGAGGSGGLLSLGSNTFGGNGVDNVVPYVSMKNNVSANGTF